MRGRNPQEQHRASTPLELLFDLAFAVTFGVAAEERAYGLAGRHTGAALAAFGF
jgi:hypothetical protein